MMELWKIFASGVFALKACLIFASTYIKQLKIVGVNLFLR